MHGMSMCMSMVCVCMWCVCICGYISVCLCACPWPVCVSVHGVSVCVAHMYGRRLGSRAPLQGQAGDRDVASCPVPASSPGPPRAPPVAVPGLRVPAARARFGPPRPWGPGRGCESSCRSKCLGLSSCHPRPRGGVPTDTASPWSLPVTCRAERLSSVPVSHTHVHAQVQPHTHPQPRGAERGSLSHKGLPGSGVGRVGVVALEVAWVAGLASGSHWGVQRPLPSHRRGVSRPGPARAVDAWEPMSPPGPQVPGASEGAASPPPLDPAGTVCRTRSVGLQAEQTAGRFHCVSAAPWRAFPAGDFP